MGLYNAVFGENDFGRALVAVLDEAQPIDVGRYRDAWVEDHDDQLLIRIHTRNGGGNREEYRSQIESMQQHPWYVRDCDDSFDSTYADFYFRIPDEIDAKLREGIIGLAQQPVDIGERWRTAINILRKSQ